MPRSFPAHPTAHATGFRTADSESAASILAASARRLLEFEQCRSSLDSLSSLR